MGINVIYSCMGIWNLGHLAKPWVYEDHSALLTTTQENFYHQKFNFCSPHKFHCLGRSYTAGLIYLERVFESLHLEEVLSYKSLITVTLLSTQSVN